MLCHRPGSGDPGATTPRRVRSRYLPLLAAALVFAGCCGYQPQPLDEQALLQRVRNVRATAPAGATLSLAEATALLRSNNPQIREARAAWRVQLAVAKVKTPLANPNIGLGPLLYGGGDILGGSSWGFEGALGWTVPVTGIQRLTDEVNRVRAAAAFTNAATVERRQYLALRADYLRAGLSADLLDAWRRLSAVALAAVETGSDMMEAGQASAVDVSLLRLDAARTQADVLTSAEAAMAERQALAGRINLHADYVSAPQQDARPTLPDVVPALEELESLAIAGNPELNLRRAKYLVREKEFRIEVRRQMPDPSVGLNYTQSDINELGLPLGIELPIFDRNQPAVHRTYAARNEARVRYRAELARIFANISAARALVETRGQTRARYEETIAPEAKRTLDTTRHALGVGATDALSYFAVLATTRAAAVDTVRAHNRVYDAWLELESACGVPLLKFPNEPGMPSQANPAGEQAQACDFPPPPPPPANESTNEKEAN